MTTFWKYHVSLSFAEEQSHIAHQLNQSLRRKCIKTYYYKNHNGFGDDLYRRSIEAYSDRVHTVLIIASPDYVRREWPQIELGIISGAYSQGRISRVYVIQTGRSPIFFNSIPRSSIHETWNNNPSEIVKHIMPTLKDELMIRPCRIWLIFVFIILLLASCGYTIATLLN